jgi:hypothetical protein
MGYAVRRHEEHTTAKSCCRARTCDEFRRVAGRDLHLPYRITQDRHTGERVPGTYFQEPLVTETIELTELSFGSSTRG